MARCFGIRHELGKYCFSHKMLTSHGSTVGTFTSREHIGTIWLGIKDGSCAFRKQSTAVNCKPFLVMDNQKNH